MGSNFSNFISKLIMRNEEKINVTKDSDYFKLDKSDIISFLEKYSKLSLKEREKFDELFYYFKRVKKYKEAVSQINFDSVSSKPEVEKISDKYKQGVSLIQVNEITEAIVSYCIKPKRINDYYFGRVTESNPEKIIVHSNLNNDEHLISCEPEISLRLMIRNMVLIGTKYVQNTDFIDARELIKICYETLKFYKIEHSGKIEIELTHYKLTVLIGLFIIEYDSSLIPKFREFNLIRENFSPSDLKDILRSITDKLK